MSAVMDDLRTDRAIGVGGGAVRTRIAIVETAIRLFRDHAFHEVTFERVAAAAGLDLHEVEESFPTWDALLLATTDLWTARRMRPITALATQLGAAAYLRAIVVANSDEPGLMRTLSALVNIAAAPGHPLAPQLHARWRAFQLVVQEALAHDVAVGREPETMEPARGAEQLIALYEGLQLQSMVRPGMDVLEAYDRAVTRLRDGWTHRYSAPVWQI